MANWFSALLFLSLPLMAAPVTRVVSLTPHLTELLYAIGAGDMLVAIDDASDYPPEVQRKPKVANYRSINLEALLAQQPDLVLAWQPAQRAMVAPLEKLGIPIFFSDPTDFASLADEMRALGNVVGRASQANRAADHYLAALAALKTRYATPKNVRVFYQLWYPPLTSVSGNAWPALAITLCGGINIMATAKSHYPQVNYEQVIRANPMLILAGNNQQEALSHWQAWPTIAAVKYQQLHLINADKLHRFTPRALDAIEQICLAIEQSREH